MKRPRERGFTMIEVAIGGLILVFVFISTLAALQAGYRLLEAARNTTLADQIMQSQIEDIRLYNWTAIDAMASGSLDLSDLTVQLQTQFDGSTRQISNVRFDSDGKPTMKKIKVVVQWQSFTGRMSTRSYETLFAKNGINDYFVTTRSP